MWGKVLTVMREMWLDKYMNTATNTVSEISELAIGDRVIYASRRGIRRGVQIDQISQGIVASGRQFSLKSGAHHASARIILTSGDARNGRIERVG
jgi:hypothetical protein